MAYNICVNCGTNLNHILTNYIHQKEMFKTKVKNTFTNLSDSEIEDKCTYFNNLFFLKYNVDRICCRAFFISFNDYIPSTM